MAAIWDKRKNIYFLPGVQFGFVKQYNYSVVRSNWVLMNVRKTIFNKCKSVQIFLNGWMSPFCNVFEFTTDILPMNITSKIRKCFFQRDGGRDCTTVSVHKVYLIIVIHLPSSFYPPARCIHENCIIPLWCDTNSL